ncbi:MAG: beta-lactamase family protein [Deltaproteobacteria bacterium]|nr:beta-lactamase family protein [Deltaproteobacteria bacterium]
MIDPTARRSRLALALALASLLACGGSSGGGVGEVLPGAQPESDAGTGDASTVDGTTPPSTTGYWPPTTGDAWETTTPAAAGFDAAKLDEAFAFAESRASTAMIVVADGRIVAERYWQGWDLHRAEQIFSAAKSITSFLVGVAQERKLLSIDDPVTKHLGAGWSKAPLAMEGTITIRHLLTMTSGLDDALSPIGEPGKKWYYSTGAYLQLGAILEKVTGSRDDFTKEVLVTRIGMRDSAWRRPVGGGLGQTMDASARDMARFGLMVSRGGRWADGDVIADKAYLSQATSTSTSLNASYGYLFWLNGKASYVAPLDTAGTGPLFPSAPPRSLRGARQGRQEDLRRAQQEVGRRSSR